MNDGEILEYVIQQLRDGEWVDKKYGGSFKPDDTRNDGEGLIAIIEELQAEEELTQRIAKEVKKQLKAQK